MIGMNNLPLWINTTAIVVIGRGNHYLTRRVSGCGCAGLGVCKGAGWHVHVCNIIHSSGVVVGIAVIVIDSAGGRGGWRWS